jgi:hypothetical protein
MDYRRGEGVVSNGVRTGTMPNFLQRCKWEFQLLRAPLPRISLNRGKRKAGLLQKGE